MAEDTKSKTDVLKSRIFPFVKESNNETSLKIPNRLLVGYKLDVVAIVIKDLLSEKYGKNLQLVEYQPSGDKDYLFNYKIS